MFESCRAHFGVGCKIRAFSGSQIVRQVDDPEKGAEMKVKDAMTTTVTSVHADAPLKEAAAILAANGFGGLPVVDDDGAVIGVISETDILSKQILQPSGAAGRRGRHRDAGVIARHDVREAMNAPPITVEAWSSVPAAARLMVEHGISRLPVVEHGRLAGIITRLDLVRAFARSDEELEREIRDALRSVAWADSIDVSVQDGEVVLRGELDSRYDAEDVPKMIRSIPGVIAVDAELKAWDGDANREVLVSSHIG
jgi:CBS domain-containing protein